MSRRLIVSPEASQEIDRIDDWWRENRLKAPELFTDELEEAFQKIVEVPQAGRLVSGAAISGVRRWPLVTGLSCNALKGNQLARCM